MQFTMQITMDNAAFDGPDGYGPELARILAETAARVAAERPGAWILRDLNGNSVGEAEVKK